MARRRKGARTHWARWCGTVVAAASLGVLAWWWAGHEQQPQQPAGRLEASGSAHADSGPPVPEDLSELDPRMPEAVENAVSSVERSPRSADAYGHLGRVYHAHKYFELAQRCYEEAHRLDPSEAAWPYYLGLFAGERGQLDRAVDLLRTARALDPRHAPTAYRLGDVLLRLGELDSAKDAFRSFLEQAPEQSWGHLGVGRVARARETWSDAVAALEEAQRRRPDHHEVIYLLAQSYRELGRSDEAHALLSKLALADHPTLEDTLLRQVFAQRQDLQRLISAANRKLAEGDTAQAEALYREVLSFDADHFDALFNLGVLYGRSERYPEAVAMLEKASKTRPRDPRPPFLLALAYINVGELQQAAETAEALLRAHPNDPRANELAGRLRELLAP